MRSLIIGAALFLTGLVAVVVGVYPAADALALLDRVWPVLLFVLAITVVAELAADAGLFDVVAAWSTRAARGSAHDRRWTHRARATAARDEREQGGDQAANHAQF